MAHGIDPHAIDSRTVCAVVLAGGRAVRMGGVDKGLQPFNDQPLAWHALQRLQVQVPAAPGLIAINANRNLADYAKWGYPVWPDANQDFAGPLAGFQTALQHALAYTSPHGLPFAYLLVVPCDSPLFALDLLQRLATGLAHAKADIAMVAIEETVETDLAQAATGDTPSGAKKLWTQPVFCLMRTTLLGSLRSYMAAGGRKIDTWMRQQALLEVPFNTPADNPISFFNANSLAQLLQLQKLHDDQQVQTNLVGDRKSFCNVDS
jgi:molybdenum cofactor guanylyltransferase